MRGGGFGSRDFVPRLAGGGGYDPQPLRHQLPSPGGVHQVRGEATAAETPVSPGGAALTQPCGTAQHPRASRPRGRAWDLGDATCCPGVTLALGPAA